jgi:rubrerythrin
MHYEYDLEEVIGWLVAKSPRHRRWVEQLLVEIKNRESKEESVIVNAE